MKISTIKKALIKQTLVISVIIAAAFGGLWYLSSMDEEYDGKINQLRTQAGNVTRQVMDLSSEYTKVTSVMDVYSEIKKKEENKMLVVNKETLRDAILAPKSKYPFDDLEVKMDAVKALEGEKYKKDTGFIESSNATVSLKALSDLDIFDLIQSLQSSFSGIKFTSLKISLAKELDSGSLIAIKDTGFAPIVNGKINFTLFGMREVNATEGDLLTDGDKPAANQNNINSRRRIRLRQP
jgi:hypothetical protein